MRMFVRVKEALDRLENSLLGDAIGTVCLFGSLYGVLLIGGLF